MSNPLLEFIANNSTAITTTGSAITGLGIGLTGARKELINRCSEWVGIKLSANRIRTEAKAQGEAALIKAEFDVKVKRIEQIGDLEISTELERARSIQDAQALKQQQNVDAIVLGALPDVKDDANPQNINEDWLNNLMDKGRLISDVEMQALWSKVLAGEANSPGKYSKRLVNLIQSIEKEEAENFRNLCRFSVKLKTTWPIVFDTDHPIYSRQGLTDAVLNDLQSLGLITYEPSVDDNGDFAEETDNTIAEYFGYKISVRVTSYSEPDIPVGSVSFTSLGDQLAGLCKLTSVDGFPEHLAETWRKMGYKAILRPTETESKTTD